MADLLDRDIEEVEAIIEAAKKMPLTPYGFKYADSFQVKVLEKICEIQRDIELIRSLLYKKGF